MVTVRWMANKVLIIEHGTRCRDWLGLVLGGDDQITMPWDFVSLHLITILVLGEMANTEESYKLWTEC